METLFVRTESNTILQMDVDELVDGEPATTARERFEERVAKGELQIIGPCHQVANADGSGYVWAEDGEDDSDALARHTRRPPASRPSSRRSDTPAKHTKNDSGDDEAKGTAAKRDA